MGFTTETQSKHRRATEELKIAQASVYRYLREREMAVCEVAYLLSFSGPSAFHRAFRRWTGVTPKEFRRVK